MSTQEPNRRGAVQWNEKGPVDCRIRLSIDNIKGIVGCVETRIGESDGTITYMGMDEDIGNRMARLRLTVQVQDRMHLAQLLRTLRKVTGVKRVEHECARGRFSSSHH